jgi:hypothetical protein
MAKARVLTAEHLEQGTLYAAVDPAVRFIEGGVRDSRFAARLAPFADEAAARLALKRAGASPAEVES